MLTSLITPYVSRTKPVANRFPTPRVVTATLAALWFATTVTSVWFVVKYRGPTPSGDEWFDVGHATGELPLDWSYLWGAANHHRVPFVRLLYAGIMRASAFDARSVAVANVLIPATAAAVALVVLRRRRGHSSLSDAAIPLALTNVGMWEPFLWNALLHAAVGVSLATMVLLIVTRRDDPTPGRVALVGALGLLMLGCGGPGVPYLPGLVVWLGFVAWRATRRRAHSVAAVAVVAATILGAGVVAYFTPDGAAAPLSTLPVSLARKAEVALQFVAIGYGPVAFLWFPFDPARVPTLGILMAATLAVVAASVAVRRNRIGLAAAAGALCLILGFAALAYGLAANRAHDSPTPGYGPRYAVMASFGVVWLTVACQLAGGRVAKGVAAAVALLAAAVWVPTFSKAKTEAAEQRNWLNELRADAEAGVPANFVARRFAANAGGHREYLEARLLGLRAKGVWPFGALGDPVPDSFEPIPGAASDGGEWPIPRCRVTGLRLTHALAPAGPVRVEWRRGDSPWVGRWYRPAPGAGAETWVWVNEDVDRVRVVSGAGAPGPLSDVSRLRPRDE